MNTIRAEVMAMAQIDLNMSYSIRVVQPIEIPFKLYRVSLLEILHAEHLQRDLIALLRKKVLDDYHVFVDNLPIMELMDLPKNITHMDSVELIELRY